ncbi:MAG: cytochrome b [Wenzhouxiangellaceae bacterium]|jgi:cytochrome b561|nr:cytochrome b [Wenzhouxiangellaceae bacterium]MBS3747759.1 cytochrome b [Wenzhouxiangellaceae bacterium]
MKLPLANTDRSYGLVAQSFHWLVVAGITAQFIWAWRIDQTDSIRTQFTLVNQHKSIGMTVLGLVVLRLLWRAVNRPPAFPGSMSGWERRAASTAHWLLYALILVMPLTGWIYSSAAGFGAEFFGLLDIPDFVAQSERLESVFGTIHEWLAKAILLVVAIHVLAALRHQFVLKDGLLRRMLPVWK